MAGHSPGWSGVAGLAWPGLAWYGMIWSGLAWSGLGWPGLVWAGLGWAGVAWVAHRARDQELCRAGRHRCMHFFALPLEQQVDHRAS